MLEEAGHINNTVVLILRQIQCLHLMNSEVAWVLASSGTQVQSQIKLNPDYFPDYLSISYDYVLVCKREKTLKNNSFRDYKIDKKRKSCVLVT